MVTIFGNYNSTNLDYNAIIYSKEKLEIVENSLNENFNNSVESDYFTKSEIDSQTANLVQIVSPKFSPEQIAVISTFSILGFFIIMALVIILACGQDSSFAKKTGIILTTWILVLAISGPLLYFTLDGTIGWDVAGSVIGIVTALAIGLTISVILEFFDK